MIRLERRELFVAALASGLSTLVPFRSASAQTPMDAAQIKDLLDDRRRLTELTMSMDFAQYALVKITFDRFADDYGLESYEDFSKLPNGENWSEDLESFTNWLSQLYFGNFNESISAGLELPDVDTLLQVAAERAEPLIGGISGAFGTAGIGSDESSLGGQALQSVYSVEQINALIEGESTFNRTTSFLCGIFPFSYFCG